MGEIGSFDQKATVEELKELRKISKHLYFLPFELNSLSPTLQLQVSEQFEISYFGGDDHSFHRMH
jgi:hypothetical protein